MAPRDKPKQASLAAQARAAIHIKQRSPSQHACGASRRGCVPSDDVSGTSRYATASLSQPLPLQETCKDSITSVNPETPMGSNRPLSSHVQSSAISGLSCETANAVPNESPPMSPTTCELTDSVLDKSRALLRYLSDFQLENECHGDSECDSEYDYPQLSLCSDMEKINLADLECVEEPKKLQEMLDDMRKMIQAQMADHQANLAGIQKKKDLLMSSTTSLSTDCPHNSLSGTNSSIASPQLDSRSFVGQSHCTIPQTDTVALPRGTTSWQAMSPRSSFAKRIVQPLSGVANGACARLRHPSPSATFSAVSPRLQRVASSGKLVSVSSCSSLPLGSPRRFETREKLGPLSPHHSLPSTHVSQTVTVTTSVQSVHGNVTTDIQSSTQISTNFHM